MNLLNIKDYDDDLLEDQLTRLSELEYKYSYVSHVSASVSRNLENQIEECCKLIAKMLLPVFEDWLKDHAILNPYDWATARVKYWTDSGESLETAVSNMEGEFERYSNEKVKGIIHYISNCDHFNWDKAPRFKEFIEAVIEDYEANQEQEDGEDAPQPLSVEDIRIDEHFETLSSLIECADNNFNGEEILIEIVEQTCFVVWFQKWEQEGIEETRETLERIALNLKNIDDFSGHDLVVKINEAICCCHQTGSFLDDYISEKHEGVNKNLFQFLQGRQTEDWDADCDEFIKKMNK